MSRDDQDVEHAVLNWLNEIGLKDAGEWLDQPENNFDNGYAAAVMSLCASLPVELIELLQPRRMATLIMLHTQAQRLDEGTNR